MKYYPLKLKPVTKYAIWGGKRIWEQYGIGNREEITAEAWMLSCRNDGVNVIENGEYAGMTLEEYIDKAGKDNVFGEGNFPLLIKIIDALDKLSVQVHPDDSYAVSRGLDAGKTEMWYILDAKPGAALVSGIKQGVTAKTVCEASEKGECEKYLNYVPVKKGDCFFIPAGLVHAIGEGILIAEIQQNSNTTYRLYDYDRRDKDGNKRELHVKSAEEVIKTEFDMSDAIVNGNLKFADGITEQTVCKCGYFSVEKVEMKKGAIKDLDTNGKMTHILCLGGEGYIKCNGFTERMKKGDSYLVPKCIDSFTLCAENDMEALMSV